MRLCSYTVMQDTGFAPNPFGGACTLAACTPNRMGLRLAPGEWIMGNSSAQRGRRLIYAMRVSEVLDFDDYFHDDRFQAKKPRPGSWRERCGDNIYFRDETEAWKQAPTFYHREPEYLAKDTRKPRVFISDYWFYFGENAPTLPSEFAPLIRTGRGCRYADSPDLVQRFVHWLEGQYAPGIIHGLPRDRDERTGAQPQLVQLGAGRFRR